MCQTADAVHWLHPPPGMYSLQQCSWSVCGVPPQTMDQWVNTPLTVRHYENAPQRLHTTFKGLTPLQHYFAFTKVYICAKVAYYISPRCVHCKKVHKKQQTITSFSQKLHKSSDTKKRRRPTHKQGVRLDTRTIVTKVPRAVYKDKQDALNKLYFGRISTSESQ